MNIITKKIQQNLLEKQMDISEADKFSIHLKNVDELKRSAITLNKDKDIRGKISNVDLNKFLIFFNDKKVYDKAKQILGIK